tara:strand:- start:194 stop:448 length:255 start_codon:yes stop_codon:yes gene_type:complete
MKHYVTAAEANAMAKEAQSIDGAYMREETDFLMLKIVELAVKGETHCAVYERIDSVVIDRIKYLGYKVVISDTQFGGYSCTISW